MSPEEIRNSWDTDEEVLHGAAKLAEAAGMDPGAAERIAKDPFEQFDLSESARAEIERLLTVQARLDTEVDRHASLVVEIEADLERARAEVERLRAGLAAVRETRDYFGEQSVENGARAEAAESALTEAREQLSRLREAVEGLADEWERHHDLLISAGAGLVPTMTYADAVRRLRAVLAGVAEQEAGESGPDRQGDAAAQRCRAEHPTNPSVVACDKPAGHGGDHHSWTGCAGSHVTWSADDPPNLGGICIGCPCTEGGWSK